MHNKQIKMYDWMFMFTMFDPYYSYSNAIICNFVRAHYKNELKNYLIGKTIKFNYGFKPPNNVGVIANIDFSGITPVIIFESGFTILVDFFDMYEYEII